MWLRHRASCLELVSFRRESPGLQRNRAKKHEQAATSSDLDIDRAAWNHASTSEMPGPGRL